MQSPLSIVGNGVPAHDSGIFIYISWELLHGKILYKDLWDHKGPIIFLLDALGLVLGGGSPQGVWLIEILSLTISGYLGFKVLSSVFKVRAALFGTIIWLITLISILEQGNLTEEYALPFQFLALYIFSKLSATKEILKRFILHFFLGVSCGITFLLRANLIGIWIAIFIILSIERFYHKQYRILFYEYISILAGLFIAVLPFLIYILHYNILEEAISAIWNYNRIYTNVSITSKLESSFNTINYLGSSGANICIIFGFLFSIYAIKYNMVNYEQNLLIKTNILGFITTIILSGLSGRFFAHYSIAYLPVLAITISFLYWNVEKIQNNENSKNKSISNYILISLIISFGYFPFFYNLSTIKNNLKNIPPEKTIAEFIMNKTEKNNYVLIWGSRPYINFLARRSSPTRFLYCFPLVTRNYTHEKIIHTFMEELNTRKPSIIVDLSPWCNMAPSLKTWKTNTINNKYYYIPEELESFYVFVKNNYKIKNVFVDDEGKEIYIYYLGEDNNE